MEGGCNAPDELGADPLLVQPEHFLSIEYGLIAVVCHCDLG